MQGRDCKKGSPRVIEKIAEQILLNSTLMRVRAHAHTYIHTHTLLLYFVKQKLNMSNTSICLLRGKHTKFVQKKEHQWQFI